MITLITVKQDLLIENITTKFLYVMIKISFVVLDNVTSGSLLSLNISICVTQDMVKDTTLFIILLKSYTCI